MLDAAAFEHTSIEVVRDIRERSETSELVAATDANFFSYVDRYQLTDSILLQK